MEAKGDLGGGWGGSCAQESGDRGLVPKTETHSCWLPEESEVLEGRTHTKPRPSTPGPSPLGIGSGSSSWVI